MATTKKYISLDKFSLYDKKIKKVISDGDAATLASANEAVSGVQTKLNEEVTRAKAAEEANAAAAKKAQDEVDALELVVQNIQENAYDDTEIRGLISGLDTNKADKTQVATDIAAAVKAEEDARKEAVQGVQDAVNTLSGTHATDKTALEAAIALKADQTALDAVSGVANAAATKTALEEEVTRATGEEARIEGLVTAETERATGVENGLKGRIETMEAFWEAAKADGTDSNVIDTLKEIQEYIAGDETGASEMAASIKKNSDDIAAMDTAYKAADTTLQGNIDTLSGVVNGKAAQADLEELEGRVETAEGEIDALQAKFGEGEGSVADMIADAVKVEEEARIAAIAEVQEDADKGIEDAAAALAAAQAASSHADELNTAMNTRVEALEAVDHSHSNQAELDLIATGDKAKWDTAATKAHEHANKTVLDGITEAKVTAWDAAEGNAKTYADGLNTTMDGRVSAVESGLAALVEASEEDINGLFA